MQLHADDGRVRDPASSRSACESGCARPRERHAVGVRPSEKRPEVCAGARSIVGAAAPGALQNARQSSDCKRFGGYCSSGNAEDARIVVELGGGLRVD